MKNWLTLLFIICTILKSNAQFSKTQQHQIDSLNTIINSPNSHDTSLTNAYVSLSEILYLSDIDTMLYLCTKAKSLAEQSLKNTTSSSVKICLKKAKATAISNIGYVYQAKGDHAKGLELYQNGLSIRKEINDSEGLISSYNNIGYLHQLKGDISLALEYKFEGLRISQEIGDKKGLAQSYNSIGYLYQHQGNIPLSLEYYYKSLEIREELNDLVGMAKSYSNIGTIHNNQKDFIQALDYYNKSLKIREEIGDKIGMSNTLMNIGSTYAYQKQFEEALKYYKRGLELAQLIGHKIGIASALINVGSVYYSLDRNLEALDYYKQALAIREEIGDKAGIAYALKSIGAIQLKLGLINEAESNLKLSWLYAKELGNPEIISWSTFNLSEIAKTNGNYKEALELYELHIQMRDSIKNEETQKATIRQQTKYEFEKAQLVKEQEEKEAARQLAEQTSRRNNLQYSLIFLSILLFFGVVLSLGFIKVSPSIAEGLIFFAFLILFEFLLVLGDPFVESITGGEPIYKLLANAVLAGAIFPAHAFFEKALKNRIVKS